MIDLAFLLLRISIYSPYPYITTQSYTDVDPTEAVNPSTAIISAASIPSQTGTLISFTLDRYDTTVYNQFPRPDLQRNLRRIIHQFAASGCDPSGISFRQTRSNLYLQLPSLRRHLSTMAWNQRRFYLRQRLCISSNTIWAVLATQELSNIRPISLRDSTFLSECFRQTPRVTPRSGSTLQHRMARSSRMGRLTKHRVPTWFNLVAMAFWDRHMHLLDKKVPVKHHQRKTEFFFSEFLFYDTGPCIPACTQARSQSH